MPSHSRVPEPVRGVGDSYTASGVSKSYGGPIADDSYDPLNKADSYGAPGTEDLFGAPGDSYGSPGTADSYVASDLSDSYGAPGVEDSYSAPSASDTYGAPAAPISGIYRNNNFGQSSPDDRYGAPNGSGVGFGGSRNSGFKSQATGRRGTNSKKNRFSPNIFPSIGSSYTEPDFDDEYISDSYGAPATNLLDLGYDDYEYDELPTYGRHSRDVQIESPSITTEKYNKENVD